MASEALEKAGLHFDDLNRIRVLDEDTSSQAQELKEVCQDFLGDIGDFQKIADSFIVIFDAVSKEVELEKMKAIGARNLLKSYAKQRESQQEQLRALIVEKKSELDRLNTQYSALAKMESEQQEFIEQFILQK
jgi:intraflagellar transport protein 20